MLYGSRAVEDQVKGPGGLQTSNKERIILLLGDFPDALDRTLFRWGFRTRLIAKEGLRSHQSEWLKEASAVLVDGSIGSATELLKKAQESKIPSVLIRAPSFLRGEIHAGVIFEDWPGVEEVRRAIQRLVACAPPTHKTPIPTEEFLTFLRERFGLVFPSRRSVEVRDSVRQRMTALRLPTASSYLDRLQRSGPLDREPDHLLDPLLVGETYLYRTPSHFETLRYQILPELMDTPRSGPLRIWSAGCSSGEEAYCLAATLLQKMPARKVDVLGTDVHRKALEAGRSGSFGAYSQRSPLPGWLQHYLPEKDGIVYANSELKNVVRFEYLNLLAWATGMVPGPHQEFDVIFCRNVLLYFDPPAARSILEALARRLRIGGVLFLGPSETVLGGETGLQVRAGLECFYLEKCPPGSSTPPRRLPLTSSEPGTPKPKKVWSGRFRAPLTEKFPWQTRPETPKPPPIPEEEQLVADGFLRMDEEDFLVARKLFEKARLLAPHAHSPRVGLLFLEANDGLYDRAQAGCEALLEKGAKSPELFYLMGLLADNRGDLKVSKRRFERALFLDSNCFMARFRLAELHQRNGESRPAVREAQNLLEQLRRLEPGALVPLSGGMAREAGEALCLGLLSHETSGRL